jgi:AhpD family alkylhydroperoxidase
MATNNYPDYREKLNNLVAQLRDEIPDTMKGFGSLHSAATKKGALDAKMKELIALGIAISVRCEGCIAYHVHDAIEAGASRDEIMETIGVAVLMGGGPALMYGAEALEALDQFEAVRA